MSAKKTPRTIDKFVDEARKKYGRSSPFRVGFLIQEAGANVANPYPKDSRAHGSFEQGIAWAKAVRGTRL